MHVLAYGKYNNNNNIIYRCQYTIQTVIQLSSLAGKKSRRWSRAALRVNLEKPASRQSPPWDSQAMAPRLACLRSRDAKYSCQSCLSISRLDSPASVSLDDFARANAVTVSQSQRVRLTAEVFIQIFYTMALLVVYWVAHSWLQF